MLCITAGNETMSGMVLQIAVVEDDSLMRLAIVSAIRLAGFEVAFETSSASDALIEAKKNIPHLDVVVLDLHLGLGPTGLDLAHGLRRLLPNLGIVFLTSFDDPRLLNSTFSELPPNVEYLTKGSVTSVEILIAALTRASENRSKDSTLGRQSPLAKLTDSQIEILRLVASGMSNAEIAKTRFVTEKSVEVSISRIAKALDIKFDSSVNQRVHIANVVFRSIGKPLK